MSSPIQLHGPNANASLEINGYPYPLSVNPLSEANLSAAGVVGDTRRVITAAKTLTAEDSGAICLFNSASGMTYTLPSAQPGLFFDFQVTVTVTSNNDRVICAVGDFFLGTVLQASDGTVTLVGRTADGSTHLAFDLNGTTKGGIMGDTIRVAAISDTQWAISGFVTATGTEATMFATS